MAKPRLITLVYSHYNEKARWALDGCGIDYEERAYAPLLSNVAVAIATRGRGGRPDSASSRYSTPILVRPGNEPLCDSTDIALWASRQAASGADDGPLFPTPDVLPLVEALGRDFGPYTRRAAYYHCFKVPEMLHSFTAANVGRAQALAFRALSPLGVALIRRVLHVDADGYERALDKIDVQLELAAERLARHRFLAGDTFTAADLTFAALMAPVLLVTQAEGFHAALPAIDATLPETRAMIAEMRGSVGGTHALDMFRRFRHARFGVERAHAAAGER
jgi:glutathione S-transferase